MPGTLPLHFQLDGTRVGVLLCEDLWQATDVPIDRVYLEDPVAELREAIAAAFASGQPYLIEVEIEGKR